MNSIKFGCAITATTLTILVAQSAHAFTVFTNRTAWQNALGGTPITTDTFSNEILNARTITFDSGVVSAAIASGAEDSANVVFSTGVYSGVVDGQGDSTTFFDTITWTFPQPIVGFGADWIRAANADRLTVTGNFDGTGNQTVNFRDVLGFPGDGFLGIVGTSPFSSITFGTQGPSIPGNLPGGSQRFGADNLSFAPASTAIPTPALLPGLVGMGLAAYRKRRAMA